MKGTSKNNGGSSGGATAGTGAGSRGTATNVHESNPMPSSSIRARTVHTVDSQTKDYGPSLQGARPMTSQKPYLYSFQKAFSYLGDVGGNPGVGNLSLDADDEYLFFPKPKKVAQRRLSLSANAEEHNQEADSGGEAPPSPLAADQHWRTLYQVLRPSTTQAPGTTTSGGSSSGGGSPTGGYGRQSNSISSNRSTVLLKAFERAKHDKLEEEAQRRIARRGHRKAAAEEAPPGKDSDAALLLEGDDDDNSSHSSSAASTPTASMANAKSKKKLLQKLKRNQTGGTVGRAGAGQGSNTNRRTLFKDPLDLPSFGGAAVGSRAPDKKGSFLSGGSGAVGGKGSGRTSPSSRPPMAPTPNPSPSAVAIQPSAMEQELQLRAEEEKYYCSRAFIFGAHAKFAQYHEHGDDCGYWILQRLGRWIIRGKQNVRRLQRIREVQISTSLSRTSSKTRSPSTHHLLEIKADTTDAGAGKDLNLDGKRGSQKASGVTMTMSATSSAAVRIMAEYNVKNSLSNLSRRELIATHPLLEKEIAALWASGVATFGPKQGGGPFAATGAGSPLSPPGSNSRNSVSNSGSGAAGSSLTASQWKAFHAALLSSAVMQSWTNFGRGLDKASNADGSSGAGSGTVGTGRYRDVVESSFPLSASSEDILQELWLALQEANTEGAAPPSIPTRVAGPTSRPSSVALQMTAEMFSQWMMSVLDAHVKELVLKQYVASVRDLHATVCTTAFHGNVSNAAVTMCEKWMTPHRPIPSTVLKNLSGALLSVFQASSTPAGRAGGGQGGKAGSPSPDRKVDGGPDVAGSVAQRNHKKNILTIFDVDDCRSKAMAVLGLLNYYRVPPKLNRFTSPIRRRTEPVSSPGGRSGLTQRGDYGRTVSEHSDGGELDQDRLEGGEGFGRRHSVSGVAKEERTVDGYLRCVAEGPRCEQCKERLVGHGWVRPLNQAELELASKEAEEARKQQLQALQGDAAQELELPEGLTKKKLHPSIPSAEERLLCFGCLPEYVAKEVLDVLHQTQIEKEASEIAAAAELALRAEREAAFLSVMQKDQGGSAPVSPTKPAKAAATVSATVSVEELSSSELAAIAKEIRREKRRAKELEARIEQQQQQRGSTDGHGLPSPTVLSPDSVLAGHGKEAASSTARRESMSTSTASTMKQVAESLIGDSVLRGESMSLSPKGSPQGAAGNNKFAPNKKGSAPAARMTLAEKLELQLQKQREEKEQKEREMKADALRNELAGDDHQVTLVDSDSGGSEGEEENPMIDVIQVDGLIPRGGAGNGRASRTVSKASATSSTGSSKKKKGTGKKQNPLTPGVQSLGDPNGTKLSRRGSLARSPGEAKISVTAPNQGKEGGKGKEAGGTLARSNSFAKMPGAAGTGGGPGSTAGGKIGSAAAGAKSPLNGGAAAIEPGPGMKLLPQPKQYKILTEEETAEAAAKAAEEFWTQQKAKRDAKWQAAIQEQKNKQEQAKLIAERTAEAEKMIREAEEKSRKSHSPQSRPFALDPSLPAAISLDASRSPAAVSLELAGDQHVAEGLVSPGEAGIKKKHKKKANDKGESAVVKEKKEKSTKGRKGKKGETEEVTVSSSAQGDGGSTPAATPQGPALMDNSLSNTPTPAASHLLESGDAVEGGNQAGPKPQPAFSDSAAQSTAISSPKESSMVIPLFPGNSPGPLPYPAAVEFRSTVDQEGGQQQGQSCAAAFSVLELDEGIATESSMSSQSSLPLVPSTEPAVPEPAQSSTPSQVGPAATPSEESLTTVNLQPQTTDTTEVGMPDTVSPVVAETKTETSEATAKGREDLEGGSGQIDPSVCPPSTPVVPLGEVTGNIAKDVADSVEPKAESPVAAGATPAGTSAASSRRSSSQGAPAASTTATSAMSLAEEDAAPLPSLPVEEQYNKTLDDATLIFHADLTASRLEGKLGGGSNGEADGNDQPEGEIEEVSDDEEESDEESSDGEGVGTEGSAASSSSTPAGSTLADVLETAAATRVFLPRLSLGSDEVVSDGEQSHGPRISPLAGDDVQQQPADEDERTSKPLPDEASEAPSNSAESARSAGSVVPLMRQETAAVGGLRSDSTHQMQVKPQRRESSSSLGSSSSHLAAAAQRRRSSIPFALPAFSPVAEEPTASDSNGNGMGNATASTLQGKALLPSPQGYRSKFTSKLFNPKVANNEMEMDLGTVDGVSSTAMQDDAVTDDPVLPGQRDWFWASSPLTEEYLVNLERCPTQSALTSSLPEVLGDFLSFGTEDQGGDPTRRVVLLKGIKVDIPTLSAPNGMGWKTLLTQLRKAFQEVVQRMSVWNGAMTNTAPKLLTTSHSVLKTWRKLFLLTSTSNATDLPFSTGPGIVHRLLQSPASDGDLLSPKSRPRRDSIGSRSSGSGDSSSRDPSKVVLPQKPELWMIEKDLLNEEVEQSVPGIEPNSKPATTTAAGPLNPATGSSNLNPEGAKAAKKKKAEEDKLRAARVSVGKAMSSLWESYLYVQLGLDQWTALQLPLATKVLLSESVTVEEQMRRSVSPAARRASRSSASGSTQVTPPVTPVTKSRNSPTMLMAQDKELFLQNHPELVHAIRFHQQLKVEEFALSYLRLFVPDLTREDALHLNERRVVQKVVAHLIQGPSAVANLPVWQSWSRAGMNSQQRRRSVSPTTGSKPPPLQPSLLRQPLDLNADRTDTDLLLRHCFALNFALHVLGPVREAKALLLANGFATTGLAEYPTLSDGVQGSIRSAFKVLLELERDIPLFNPRSHRPSTDRTTTSPSRSAVTPPLASPPSRQLQPRGSVTPQAVSLLAGGSAIVQQQEAALAFLRALPSPSMDELQKTIGTVEASVFRRCLLEDPVTNCFFDRSLGEIYSAGAQLLCAAVSVVCPSARQHFRRFELLSPLDPFNQAGTTGRGITNATSLVDEASIEWSAFREHLGTFPGSWVTSLQLSGGDSTQGTQLHGQGKKGVLPVWLPPTIDAVIAALPPPFQSLPGKDASAVDQSFSPTSIGRSSVVLLGSTTGSPSNRHSVSSLEQSRRDSLPGTGVPEGSSIGRNLSSVPWKNRFFFPLCISHGRNFRALLFVFLNESGALPMPQLQAREKARRSYKVAWNRLNNHRAVVGGEGEQEGPYRRDAARRGNQSLQRGVSPGLQSPSPAEASELKAEREKLYFSLLRSIAQKRIEPRSITPIPVMNQSSPTSSVPSAPFHALEDGTVAYLAEGGLPVVLAMPNRTAVGGVKGSPSTTRRAGGHGGKEQYTVDFVLPAEHELVHEAKRLGKAGQTTRIQGQDKHLAPGGRSHGPQGGAELGRSSPFEALSALGAAKKAMTSPSSTTTMTVDPPSEVLQKLPAYNRIQEPRWFRAAVTVSGDGTYFKIMGPFGNWMVEGKDLHLEQGMDQERGFRLMGVAEEEHQGRHGGRGHHGDPLHGKHHREEEKPGLMTSHLGGENALADVDLPSAFDRSGRMSPAMMALLQRASRQQQQHQLGIRSPQAGSTVPSLRRGSSPLEQSDRGGIGSSQRMTFALDSSGSGLGLGHPSRTTTAERPPSTAFLQSPGMDASLEQFLPRFKSVDSLGGGTTTSPSRGQLMTPPANLNSFSDIASASLITPPHSRGVELMMTPTVAPQGTRNRPPMAATPPVGKQQPRAPFLTPDARMLTNGEREGAAKNATGTKPVLAGPARLPTLRRELTPQPNQRKTLREKLKNLK